MSIMPEGGWRDAPTQPNVDEAQRAHPAHLGRNFTSSYLTCKVCDRGALSSKKVYRLSGPAVVIGYILLIPSILGIISCALMLVLINARWEDTLGVHRSAPSQSFQSSFDSSFRQSCAASVRRNYQAAGVPAPPGQVEKYCECALSTFKETGSETTTAETCNQRANDGSLETPDENVAAFYSGEITREGQDTAAGSRLFNFFRALGSTFVIATGVGFFVGGLLGWLLVMKKRVLQCHFCGAVVNAS